MTSRLCILGDFVPFGRSILNCQGNFEQDAHFLYPRTSENGVDADCFEEELYISGNRVAWTAGGSGRVCKTFTLPSKVVQAVWCRFPSQPEEHLCVLHRNGLVIYSMQDLGCPVVLPCKVKALWPHPEGLILERERHSAEIEDEEDPLLFSMVNPLEEVRPIGFSAGGKEQTKKGGFAKRGLKVPLIAFPKPCFILFALPIF